jgi:hypothetical protein
MIIFSIFLIIISLCGTSALVVINYQNKNYKWAIVNGFILGANLVTVLFILQRL